MYVYTYLCRSMKEICSLYSQIRGFQEVSTIHYQMRMLKQNELDVAICLKYTMVTRLAW